MSAASSHSHDVPVPRGPLLALGALVGVALLATAAVRLAGVEIREPDAPAATVRVLRFADRDDGAIVVLDAASGRTIDTVTGEAGFVRGALRGLARERRRAGIGAEPPFELVGRTDGRLTLLDPATGQRIDLESFGPTNAGAFARWLTAPPR